VKLIPSRKGFDSGYGGIASPILPDGRLVSFPIPSDHDGNTMSDLNCPGVNVDKLLRDLSSGRIGSDLRIHLDPDLDRPFDARLPGWRPSLGQTGNAQSHLRASGVGPEDVFLFFGWFRQVESHKGRWRYVRSAPDLHILFGWIEVAEVLPIVREREWCLARHPWIANHPHVSGVAWYTDERNSLYVARQKSAFTRSPRLGGGRFEVYDEALRLTRSGGSRSIWTLPAWFLPNGRPPLTYHPKPDQWKTDGDFVTLRSAAKGQEFVIDGSDYPELESWVSSVIQRNAGLGR
jgi:hypothetical protein